MTTTRMSEKRRRWLWFVTSMAIGLALLGACVGLTWTTPAPQPLTLSTMDGSAIVTCQNIANENWTGSKKTERCYREVSRDFSRLSHAQLTTRQLKDLSDAITNCANNASLWIGGYEACVAGVTNLAKSV
jgi:hypothetical protein